MRLPDLLRHNFWLKVFSLVLATMLWYVIRFEMRLSQPSFSHEGVQKFPNLTVTVLTDTVDTNKYQVVPNKVSVTVSGNATEILKLTEKDFQVFVNMTDPTDLIMGFIRKVEVLKPLGIALVRVEPPVVQVEVKKPPPAN